MLRLAFASGVGLVLCVPASADWTQAQRAHFLGRCVESCLTTLQRPDSKRTCDAICGCVADQTETQVTPTEMYATEEAAAAGRTTETMEKIRGFLPACARTARRMP